DDAHRVDEANLELARDERRRHEPTAGDGDDAFPVAELVEDARQVPRIAVELRPRDDDLVLVGTITREHFAAARAGRGVRRICRHGAFYQIGLTPMGS